MKKLIWAILATILLGGPAYADIITGDIAGDNNISYWNGSAWVAEGTNWRISEPLPLTINSSSDIIYFAVSNDVQATGNPSGLLASFTDTDGTFTSGGSTILSGSPDIEVLAMDSWLTDPVEGTITLGQINPTISPVGLTGWGPTTSYGANGDTSTIWQSVLGGQVPGIGPNAQWIWTDSNDQDYDSEQNYAYFEVNLGVSDGFSGSSQPVPEPPSMALMLLGLACAAGFTLRRKLMLAR